MFAQSSFSKSLHMRVYSFICCKADIYWHVLAALWRTDFNFHISHVSLSPSHGHGHHFLSQHISINWSVVSTLFSYQICVLRLIEGHIEQIHQSWPQSTPIKVLCLTIYNSYISWTMRKKMRKVHIAAGEVINLCGCGSHRPRSNLCAGLSKQ